MSSEGPDDPRLESIYDKLERMDPNTFDKRAGELLFGLGFSQKMMHKATKDMSGGWRMRVALAQVRPGGRSARRRGKGSFMSPWARECRVCSRQPLLNHQSSPAPAAFLSASKPPHMSTHSFPHCQALFVKPMLLVLDEPTNHLDLGACVWLEDYLANWESILLLTSHSGACTLGYKNK
jgi:hypothetical protein